MYVNVNLAKNDGTTPVFCAAENGKEGMKEILLLFNHEQIRRPNLTIKNHNQIYRDLFNLKFDV